MNLNEVPQDQPNMWYDPKQPYTQMLIDTFCYRLSPQELPYNTSAKLHMDEELWMPIRVLAKLPAFDSLLLSDIMIPFIAQTLYNGASYYLEVDVARELVRPRWALRSSVFITNVDIYATADQIYGLLEDLRSSVMHPNNPYEFENINIAKQTATSWSISFKSPTAGPYAAMSMKSKFINGALVLPMACVHIIPPRAFYSNKIVAMEVDALQYGDPVIPIGYLHYYSENPAHMDLLYNTSMMSRQVPMYHENFTEQGALPFNPPVLKERSYSNQSFCTQPSVEKGNEIDEDSVFQEPQTNDQPEYDHHSTGDQDTLGGTQGETGNGTMGVNQNLIGSPQTDIVTQKQEKEMNAESNQSSPGEIPQTTNEMPNPTPPKESLPDTSTKVPDIIEPKIVVKTGEKMDAPTLVSNPETGLNAQSSLDTQDNAMLKTPNDTKEDWDDPVLNCSMIPYPKPETLDKPSFVKPVQLESSISGKRNEERRQEQVVLNQNSQSHQMNVSSDSNAVPSAVTDGTLVALHEQNEWQVSSNRKHSCERENSGERLNRKGRGRQSPHGRRRHNRRGSSDSSRPGSDRDNSSNGSGSRRRNGQNRKARNRGQRFNGENQQRNSHHNGRDHRENLSNAVILEGAGDTNLPSGPRKGRRDDDWQTISYKRFGPRGNQRSYSTLEGNGGARAGQQTNLPDRRLRSFSTHSQR